MDGYFSIDKSFIDEIKAVRKDNLLKEERIKELQVENKDLQKVVEEKGQLLIKMEEYWKEQFKTVVEQRDQAEYQREIWRKSSEHWYKAAEEFYESGLKRIDLAAYLTIGLSFSLMTNLGWLVGFFVWWYCR